MLTVENLHLHYGASHILRGVSLEAKPGEVTCIMGRNGVGKTSLLRAILGLHPSSQGRIIWSGKEVTGLAAHRRARTGRLPEAVYRRLDLVDVGRHRRGSRF